MLANILGFFGGLSLKKVLIGVTAAALLYSGTLAISFAKNAVADRETVVRQQTEIHQLLTEVEVQKLLADQYREAQAIADKVAARTGQQLADLTKAREQILIAQETDNAPLSNIYRDSLAAIRDSLRPRDSGNN